MQSVTVGLHHNFATFWWVDEFLIRSNTPDWTTM